MSEYVSHPHNEILYRLAESGLIGGAGLFILLAVFGYGLFKLGRERGGLYLSLLIPIGLHTQFGYPLYQSAAHWMLFLMLCYLPSSHFTKSIPLKLNRAVRLFFAAVISGILILSAVFLIRTFKAQISMTKYSNLLLSKGEINMSLLWTALDNAYLEQTATRFLMDARLRLGLSQHKNDWLRDFVKWSKKERQSTPYPSLYLKEARALYALGSKKEAIDLLDEGLSLYPGKQDLLETKATLASENSL